MCHRVPLGMVDSIATMARRLGYSTLPGLGRQWTMLEDFYTGRLDAPGITTRVTEGATCLEVDQINWDELTRGVFTD